MSIGIEILSFLVPSLNQPIELFFASLMFGGAGTPCVRIVEILPFQGF